MHYLRKRYCVDRMGLVLTKVAENSSLDLANMQRNHIGLREDILKSSLLDNCWNQLANTQKARGTDYRGRSNPPPTYSH
jgi:hypothetical protein